MLSLLALLSSVSFAAPSGCSLATDRYVPTADGATVALHHHPGSGPPVLAVHGISSNHRFWDLDDDHSLAVWLNREGFDVWLLDLRGHGQATTAGDGSPQPPGWDIDDYGRYDVPAAVDHIRACTGRSVAYVGHSMGGIVAAIALATGSTTFSSLITVGSPVAFAPEANPLMKLARIGFGFGGAVMFRVGTPILGDLASFLGPAMPGRLQERLYNPANMEPWAVDPMLQTVVSPVWRGEMRQFSRMLRDGRLTDATGQIDYFAQLSDVTVPTLVIAGAGDQVAPPGWVEPWIGALGGPTRFVTAGKTTGFKEDYGHLDLGLGRDADREIFPLIAEWLRAYPPERAAR